MNSGFGAVVSDLAQREQYARDSRTQARISEGKRFLARRQRASGISSDGLCKPSDYWRAMISAARSAHSVSET